MHSETSKAFCPLGAQGKPGVGQRLEVSPTCPEVTSGMLQGRWTGLCMGGESVVRWLRSTRKHTLSHCVLL